MNCIFTEKVSSLIDGELSQTETREVERHLMSCVECQEMRADFLSLRTRITNFETSLQPTVQNRALKKILATQRRAPALGFQWSFGKAVAFASLLIIAAISGFVVYQGSKSTQTGSSVAVNTPTPVPSSTVQQHQRPQADASPAPKKENEETTQPRQTPSAPKRKIVREPRPGEQFAAIPEPPARPADARPADAQTMTAIHFDKSETLLVGFRNVRLNEPGSAEEIAHERKRAQQLVYQNMMLRREAGASGDVQTESLLESLEPILLDIANLPDKPDKNAVRVIRERVERKNIVPLLRVNSMALARAFD